MRVRVRVWVRIRVRVRIRIRVRIRLTMCGMKVSTKSSTMSPFLRWRGWKMRTVHRSALRRQEGGHSEQEISEVDAGLKCARGYGLSSPRPPPVGQVGSVVEVGKAVVAEVLERVLLLERLLHDGGGEGGNREAQVDDHLERVDAG